ncbi:DUF2267 domain-containing protein [Leptolyngbya sp. FACHB-261]|uniref:DUF2267 domain-containing protein n=1 Tax=Leptolyngbya sp. FACHB-261 TaxID=2692806 RepID=UPI0018EF581C|nr:DUF2267 domain-containing protein [Leptolyngbya sp. FACHB-261]
MTGLNVFDRTTELTYQWVNEVAKELGLDDKHKAFQGLRATLHVLRDRLTIGEAANLGAELPILLSGFYYESWKPERTPSPARSKAEFLNLLREHLHSYSPKSEPDLDIEQLARAVFRVMTNHIPAGEMEDITGILSAEVKELFPEAVRT